MTPEALEQLQHAIEALGAGVEPGAGMWGLLGTMVSIMAAVIFALFKMQSRRDDRFLEAMDKITDKLGVQRKEDRDAVVGVEKELRSMRDVCVRRLQPAQGDNAI